MVGLDAGWDQEILHELLEMHRLFRYEIKHVVATLHKVLGKKLAVPLACKFLI